MQAAAAEAEQMDQTHQIEVHTDCAEIFRRLFYILKSGLTAFVLPHVNSNIVTEMLSNHIKSMLVEKTSFFATFNSTLLTLKSLTLRGPEIYHYDGGVFTCHMIAEHIWMRTKLHMDQ